MISSGIAKIPRWLHHPIARDAESTLVPSSSGSNTTTRLSPVKVGVVFIIGAFLTLRFAQIIAKDLSSYATARILLWLVFGGHEQLKLDETLVVLPLDPSYATIPESCQAIGSPVIIVTPPEDTRSVVERDTKLITVVEVIDFLEVTPDIVELYTPRIQDWLTEAIHELIPELNITSADGSMYPPNPVEAAKEVVQVPQSVVASNEPNDLLTPTTMLDEAEAFLASVNGLPDLFAETHNPQLAAILFEHDFPTFNTGENIYASNQASEAGPIHISVFAGGTDLMSWPDRPVAADKTDLDYMAKQLTQYLPAQMLQRIISVPSEYWYRTRDASGFNVLVRDLELEWFRLVHNVSLTMNSEVIKLIVGQYRKRYTPACPRYWRFQYPPTDSARPYLDIEEEFAINEGIADYNGDYRAVEVVGEVQHTLRTNAQFSKLDYGSEPILKWLSNVEEERLVDPHVYGRCKCGEAAMQAVRCFRRQDESHYNSKTQRSFRKFPLRQMPEHESDDRYVCDVEQRTAYPRSQQITQICKQHKTVTDNIFVLVDTSIKDINDRLSNPGGILPVPGRRNSSVYPDGWQVKKHGVQPPFEQRPPRCRHGFLHSKSCSECFPRRHFALQCQECIEYRLALNARHHNLKVLDAARGAGPEATQGQQNVDLAQHIQARRQNDLLARFTGIAPVRHPLLSPSLCCYTISWTEA
ncbi:hypothetical protein ACET3X_007872 [Alternaria dauci]|uniref:Uncharacterized protein n=1 Tax=Alternaria dauci TaxID=48095 RepID=A0ABR3UFU3_9PLEO